uniref:Uncharacterized protein n=1 Tax=Solanum lycopersicum TaxID=4081 RepID=A0A3Q7I247_SOLLC
MALEEPLPAMTERLNTNEIDENTEEWICKVQIMREDKECLPQLLSEILINNASSTDFVNAQKT